MNRKGSGDELWDGNGMTRSFTEISIDKLSGIVPAALLDEVNQRLFRRSLIVVAAAGLVAGIGLFIAGLSSPAHWVWALATLPVVMVLAVSMSRELISGRLGVDAVALLSMSAALVLGQPLAAIVVAMMYAGGNVLEDFAVARAESDLKSLVDRAPRLAHLRQADGVKDVAIEVVAAGDRLLVRGGEVVPVDGTVASQSATIDESALTGEPIPVGRGPGEPVRSGTLNAGDTFEMTAAATAGESTYAGIVRMVTAAQTAKAPFIRLADRFALLLLPVAAGGAGLAWLLSGDSIRGLAVLVTATPCPLILAAPVAFIGGVSRAARRGILIKGGNALEALARAHTVMFDKTGTLTVGSARLISIELAPGESADAVLRLAASLEQASQHVVAMAVVASARARNLLLELPENSRETMGSGLEGRIGGKLVRVGSHQFVFGGVKPSEWATRALRRASWRSALSVFVAVDGRGIGALLLADELRRESPRAVQTLRSIGIKRIVMVTGDHADASETSQRSISMPCWRIGCRRTKSMPSRSSSGCIRPSWWATASTMLRRSPPPMSALPWAGGGQAHRRRQPMLSSWLIGSTESRKRLSSRVAHARSRFKASSPAWLYRVWPCSPRHWAISRRLPARSCKRSSTLPSS